MYVVIVKIHTIEVFMLVVDGVLYNESRSTLAALLALAPPAAAARRRLVVVGRAFSRVSPALLPRFASLGQAAGRG